MHRLFVVSADEGADGEPDHSTAAGERDPEGRSQLSHHSDGEQVSLTLLEQILQIILCHDLSNIPIFFIGVSLLKAIWIGILFM